MNVKITCLKFHLALLHVNLSPEHNLVLTEERKLKCIERLKNIKISYMPKKETLKDAAVLVPLCIVNDQLSLLYTLRSSELKRNRRQASFPGGVKDLSDGNIETTAIREAEEELGIDRQIVDIWGHGNPIIGTEYSVWPVLGFLGKLDLNKLKPNPSEVEFPFTLSIKHLCDPHNIGYTKFRNLKNGYILPVYLNGTCRVWGITALITHIVLSAWLPDRYKNIL
uniref:Nudix hydrolase domain-containing protein n=2 Tax=Clastoptera arizonana TaxID=38151 RepID=A0A1B6BX62_9HEMI